MIVVGKIMSLFQWHREKDLRAEQGWEEVVSTRSIPRTRNQPVAF